MLVEIKEQNTQVLTLLKRKEPCKTLGIPSNIPVKFPMDTEEHIVTLDNYLKEDENLNTLVNISNIVQFKCFLFFFLI